MNGTDLNSSNHSDKFIAARSTQSQQEDFTSLLTDFKPQTTFDFCREDVPIRRNPGDMSPNSFEHFLSKGSFPESSPTRASKSSKIADLERQIELLKKQLTLEKSIHEEANQSQMSLENTVLREEPVHLSITDFTPEWDYLEGGSKVIICIDINKILPQSTKVLVCFGDNIVDGTWIQHNVIKCFGRSSSLVPSSLYEGKTPLTLKMDNVAILVHKAHYYFEYRNKEQKKRKRSVMVDDSNDELIDKAFKSRLITKLGFSGSSDYDMSLFGDNFSDTWSMTKENLEKDFSDSRTLKHLKEVLDKLDTTNRKKVVFDQIGT